MKKIFHIAFAADDSFAYPLAVTITSCMENNRHLDLKIHLFSAALSDNNISKFRKLIESYDQSFTFYRLDHEVFRDFPVNERISHATYYRILIPGLIDSSVDKFLYLDADLVVKGDLSPLLHTEMGDNIIAAINDVAAIDADMHRKHQIPDEYMYFNAGVLWINKVKWIEKGVTGKVLGYLGDHSDLCAFHDQDALNAVLYSTRYPLSPIWNQQIGLFYTQRDIIEKAYDRNWEKALKDPVIIHFNGQEKPWNRVSGHPLNREFRKYAGMVKDFQYSEKFNWKKAFKKHVIYTFFGWGRVNRYYVNKAKKKQE